MPIFIGNHADGDIQHIPGTQNPADIGTRGQANLEDLGLDSLWQCGPSFLQLDYNNWPTTSVLQRQGMDAPEHELWNTASVLTCQSQPSSQYSVTEVASLALVSGSPLGLFLSCLVASVLEREKLELSARALARALKAVLGNDRRLCLSPPSSCLVEFTIFVMLQASSASARKALGEGKLQGLGGVIRGGVVWVSGRIRGERLAELLGTMELPVLMPTEELSRSIIRKAHRQDHWRNPQDMAARSRRLMWIVGATRTAKSQAG